MDTVLHASNPDEWEAIVSECFVPLRCQSFDDNFSGEMTHAALDEGASISRLTTGGLRVERTPRLAARSAGEDLHLSFQLRATGRIHQHDRVVHMTAGDLAVYPTYVAYQQDYSRPHQRQLILQMPRRVLDVPTGVLSAAYGRLRMPPSRLSRALRRHLLHRLAPPEQGALPWSQHVLNDLVSTALVASHANRLVVPRSSGALYLAMIEHIEDNFTSPGFSLESVADEHFISRRTLYNVFDEAGAHPSETLRHRRLAHAALLLQQADRSAASIGSVALSSGFSDVTTFTRAFRRRYGVTPRDFRRLPPDRRR